jgi:hypothetical protein
VTASFKLRRCGALACVAWRRVYIDTTRNKVCRIHLLDSKRKHLISSLSLSTRIHSQRYVSRDVTFHRSSLERVSFIQQSLPLQPCPRLRVLLPIFRHIMAPFPSPLDLGISIISHLSPWSFPYRYPRLCLIVRDKYGTRLELFGR